LKAQEQGCLKAGARLYLAPHVGKKTKTKGAGYKLAPAFYDNKYYLIL